MVVYRYNGHEYKAAECFSKVYTLEDVDEKGRIKGMPTTTGGTCVK
jgi:hypothetical protein